VKALVSLRPTLLQRGRGRLSRYRWDSLAWSLRRWLIGEDTNCWERRWGMTATAVSPFSWEHHWVWFVPLPTCIAHLALSEKSNRRLPTLCVIYLLGFNWLVSCPIPGCGRTPPAGLFLDTGSGIEYVSRNIYILALRSR
jgi:hypothetical protein